MGVAIKKKLLTVLQDYEHVMSKRMAQTGVLHSGRFLSLVQSLDLVGWKGIASILAVIEQKKVQDA